MGSTHLCDTRNINLRERWTDFLWQGRFASFPVDEGYLRQCVRYVSTYGTYLKLLHDDLLQKIVQL